MAREQFSTRLGFLLITAGCAIGLGNVWRFPYITGQYGGAIFVLIYICFLFCVGIPLLTMELAVGRASRRSLGQSFEVLTPNTKWKYNKFWMIPGNYILMSFYSLVTGWMLYYMLKVSSGGMGQNLDQAGAGQIFNDLLASPGVMLGCTIVVVIFSFAVCAFGLKRGVERITKPMMLLLFALLIFLAVRSFTLPGFSEGVSYYLMPNFEQMQSEGVLNALSAAMGQSFFTLGLGVGSIQIFGSYMSRQYSLGYEALTLTILDTTVALLAGLVIFPACFTYAVEPGQGPGLIFVTLVSVFSHMENGAVWGGIFFVFMLFAAVSTLIAVFENIISITVEVFGITRLKSVVYNCIAILVLGLPCLFGYNYLSDIHPLGGSSTLLDTYDFVLSNNILPFGATCYVLYVTLKRGWGFNNYLIEANQGQGFKIPRWAVYYYRTVLPLVIAALFIQGYIAVFG